MNISAGFTIMRSRYDVDSRTITKRTGKSIRAVQNVMSPTANPTVRSVEIICQAIGCSVEELIHEANKCK